MFLLIQLVFFLVGLIVLLIFANIFVNSAVKLAYLLKISPLIVGSVVMGFGTSLPELAVAIFGSLRGSSGLVAGNIIGSNVTNIGLTLGASFLVGKIRIGTTKTQIMSIIHLFVTLIFLTLLAYGLLVSSIGLVFLLAGLIILFWQIKAGHQGAKVEDRKLFKNHRRMDMGIGSALRLVLFGLVGTFGGGKILVDSSLNIAETLGIAPSIIGLTAVALGTSVPELTTDIIATRKGEGKLVVGETLGTNIFNILLVGGVASLFSPLYFTNMTGIVALLIGTFSFSAIVYFCRGKNVSRTWGIVLMAGYFVYLVALARMI